MRGAIVVHSGDHCKHHRSSLSPVEECLQQITIMIKYVYVTTFKTMLTVLNCRFNFNF